MDEFTVICFSTEQNYLQQLLTETQNYFGDSAIKYGFQDKSELLQFLKVSSSDKKVKIIIIDLQQSDNESLQFLTDVRQNSPNAIKLITSESNHLLNIQEQIRNLDSIHFLNRSCTKEDFKIAFNTEKYHYSNLQILNNHKSEISGYSKKLEEKVSTRFKELTNSNLSKEKLFSVIAHDLKSPFNALLGISELLISDWNELTDKEKLDLVKGLKATSENTYKLLETLLAWSNSQEEKIETANKPFNVNPIIKTAIKVAKNSTVQKNIKIENSVDENMLVTGDANMISTVFRNLISNAVKFIQHGGLVTISSELNNHFCTFCVADNGNGVSESYIINHFKRDNQNQKENNLANFKGLGLLLSKDFVERNGGQIWLETQKHEGSKFYFTVPC